MIKILLMGDPARSFPTLVKPIFFPGGLQLTALVGATYIAWISCRSNLHTDPTGHRYVADNEVLAPKA